MYRLQPCLASVLGSCPVPSSSSASCSMVNTGFTFKHLARRQSSSLKHHSRPVAHSRRLHTVIRSTTLLPASCSPFPSSITSLDYLSRLRPSASTYTSSCIRCFSHLADRSAQKSSSNDSKPSTSSASSSSSAKSTSSSSTPSSSSPPTTLGKSSNLTIDNTPSSKDTGNKEQRLRDIQIIKRLLPNIWPRGETGTKARVVIAIALLVGGKVGLFQALLENSSLNEVGVALAAPQRPSTLLLQEHSRLPQHSLGGTIDRANSLGSSRYRNSRL